MKNVCKQVAWFRKAEKNVEFFKQESEDYMKNKKTYESPQTKHVEVELEEGFMKASVVDKDEPNSDVTAGNQTISDDYDFTGNEWQ